MAIASYHVLLSLVLGLIGSMNAFYDRVSSRIRLDPHVAAKGDEVVITWNPRAVHAGEIVLEVRDTPERNGWLITPGLSSITYMRRGEETLILFRMRDNSHLEVAHLLDGQWAKNAIDLRTEALAFAADLANTRTLRTQIQKQTSHLNALQQQADDLQRQVLPTR